MAPILESGLEAYPVIVVSLAAFLIIVLAVLLCAGGDEDKKPQRMKPVPAPAVVFSNITGPSGGAQGPGPGPGPVKTKLKLHETVPIQQADQPMGPAKSKQPTESLKIDALQILRNALNNDASLKKLTIDSKRFNVTEIIGKGNFGLVYKGSLLDKNLSNPKDVAVKTVHGNNCTKEDVESFIKESVRMRGFAHQHVLCITGIVTRENKPYIVLPYMANGDLKSFVSDKRKKFTLEELARFGYQVAQGMAYLACKNFIHRDLAARNCMVAADSTVKVADFGLSRDLYEADYYKMSNLSTPLPIRWVAVESILSSKFTSKSDVWSFGVLLWELMTRGKSPYSEIRSNLEVVKFLKEGKRLECPRYVTDSLRNVMLKCWQQNPKDRPGFDKICTIIHYILNEENDYVNMRREGMKSVDK